MVRIPNTCSKRSSACYAKLLRSVRRIATSGFDFEGTLLKPGITIEEAALWPAPDYPETPVLLECAGSTGTGWGHNRSPWLFVLWQYDHSAGEFVEIARSLCAAGEWIQDLAELARSLIEAPRKPIAPNVAEISRRIAWALEIELERLDDRARGAVLANVYNLFAARLVTEKHVYAEEKPFLEMTA